MKNLPKKRVLQVKDGTTFTVRYKYKGDKSIRDIYRDILKRKLQTPDK